MEILYHLFYFIFSVVKGLNVMMKALVEAALFKGYLVGNGTDSHVLAFHIYNLQMIF
jgi:hypothetical protein